MSWKILSGNEMKQAEDKICSMTISYLTGKGPERVEVVLKISFTVKTVEEPKVNIEYGKEK